MTHEDEILERLRKLEHHIINLNVALQSANHLAELINKPLSVDDRHLAYILAEIKRTVGDFKEQSEKIDIKQTFNEIKYIGKRLDAIEKDIASMKETGVKKNIHLDFTLDGYEMVRKSKNYAEEMEENVNKKEIDNEIDIKDVLNTLQPKEAKALMFRFGLLKCKKGTYEWVGKQLKVSKERARLIVDKALRKLRHPIRIEKVKILTHKELRTAVCGE